MKDIANFQVNLSDIHEQSTVPVDFFTKVAWVESQGHRVTVNVQKPKDVMWLVEQITPQPQPNERRPIVLRLTIGAIAATAAIVFGAWGWLI